MPLMYRVTTGFMDLMKVMESMRKFTAEFVELNRRKPKDIELLNELRRLGVESYIMDDSVDEKEIA